MSLKENLLHKRLEREKKKAAARKESLKKQELLKKKIAEQQAAGTVRSADPVKFKGRILHPIRRFRDWWKAGNKKKTILVRMQLSTGNWRTMWVTIHKNSFSYMKHAYYLDDKLKYYDIDARAWCYDFHQSISIPISRHIDSMEVKKAIKSSKAVECDAVVNPSVLYESQHNDVIVNIFQGGKINKMIRSIFTIVIIMLIVILAVFGVVLYASGLLNSVGVQL